MTRFGACFEMQCCFLFGGENAGAFERNINAQLAPWQLFGVTNSGDFHWTAASINGVAETLTLEGSFPCTESY